MIEPSQPGISLRRQCDMYLVATIDRFSPYVLAWQLSNTLDSWFCLDALHRALLVGYPENFNTGQGVQFADEFHKPKQPIYADDGR
jgi:hypothetical protein